MKVGWGLKIFTFVVLFTVILILLFPKTLEVIPYMQPGIDF